MPIRRVFVLLLSLVAACGGKTIDDGSTEPGGPPDESTIPGSDDDPVQSSGGGPSRPGSNPFPSEQLPPCEKGFDPDSDPSRSCNWVADDLCYEDKRVACSCICPEPSGTICSSGLPVADGRVRVTCL